MLAASFFFSLRSARSLCWRLSVPLTMGQRDKLLTGGLSPTTRSVQRVPSRACHLTNRRATRAFPFGHVALGLHSPPKRTHATLGFQVGTVAPFTERFGRGGREKAVVALGGQVPASSSILRTAGHPGGLWSPPARRVGVVAVVPLSRISPVTPPCYVNA